ncbi:MAG: S1C family serine protease [Acidimicrobiales bacterium]
MPSPPRRRSNAPLLVLVVVAALIASAFVGAGAREWLQSSSVTASPTPSTDGTLSQQSNGGRLPSGGSGGSGSGGSGSTAATPSDWNAVTAAIVPGVVDIESRVSGGVAAGTGMVLTDTGEILTNNHVVEGASQIVVTVVSTGKEYKASIVGTDAADDVAVLQLKSASGLTTIPLGDSDKVEVADAVAAIGNAGGAGGQPAVAIGQVVALHQQITAGDAHSTDTETLTDMIQVDADVVAGDSGGPLASSDGKVIGMDTAAAGSNGRFRTSVSQAFAIPINRALSIAEQIVAHGSVSGSSGSGSSGSGSSSSGSSSGSSTSGRGFLGVQVQTDPAGGAEVVGVVSGSAADEAGLQAGDVIVGIDGSSVDSADQLTSALTSTRSGDQVELTWQATDGQSYQATVQLQSA